ncbi:hypothetical protein [Pseudomonas syringae group genomosp. 7]|uniref:hypothetical protein n=1 Tax=Pseudomonas syringae group genomosp. 7 TaxID=251699 RepID=UPI0006D61496|nr:hypothetical protein [Pseudomonas syringae group genomosp. 7]UNB61837.1 hypothetical protein MME54_19690 [Pseudomonas syringae pv. helianthi]
MKQHDAAVPQEKIMIGPFIVKEKDSSQSIPIAASAALCSGLGIGLSDGFVQKAELKADLIERRLLRLEAALGLLPICAD